jgi:N6-L-threonylcarbamoyladenine synthase
VAYARRLPLVPVDHLLGHVAALRLAPLGLEPPFACLLASGGHTLVLDVADYAAPRRLGGTRDDAAGEAFDKGARLLGLSESGGAALERTARAGDPARFPFPPVLRGQDGHDLSFSGLKTALLRRVRELGDGLPDARADLAAGFQAAIVQQLAERAEAALDATERTALAVVGGVAANGALRAALGEICERRGARLCLLPPALCVDNAAMIGAAAFAARALEPGEYLALDAYARSPLAG